MSHSQTTSAGQQPKAFPTTLDRGPASAPSVDESSARVLAMLVAANGRIDERELQALDRRELQALDRLDAFQRLGVTRERVIELAQGCIDVIGVGLSKKAWLRAVHLDALLDEVDDCRSRLFVCRLAAAVLVADGRITRDKRVVYERVLSRWRVSQMMVCRAIMSDPTRAAGHVTSRSM
jgi:hypothetical protein